MARTNAREKQYGRNAVVGSLAYDYDYLERERRREQRTEQREEFIRPPQRKEQRKAAKKTRVREKISMMAVLSFVSVAGAVMMVILSYAQLTGISNSVVGMQKELRSLEEEHVALLTEYEQTFDLAAVKAAAEEAGMYKPSASQVYYIDLSAPDNVTLYETKDTVVLTRIFSSFGRSVASAVEYFS